MKQDTLIIHSEEVEHVIEFPQGISSINIDGVRLIRETHQINILVWIFRTCAAIGLFIAISYITTLLDKINAIEESVIMKNTYMPHQHQHQNLDSTDQK